MSKTKEYYIELQERLYLELNRQPSEWEIEEAYIRETNKKLNQSKTNKYAGVNSIR